MTIDPIIILLIIGAFGGMVRSILGYETQADEGEQFDIMKAAKSIIRGAIGGTVVVMGMATIFNSPITTTTYITAFLAAVGADVIMKELYGTVNGG